MIDTEKIISEAKYYLENDVTIEQASFDLGLSKKTLQNHFKVLQSIDLDLFNKVEEKKKNNVSKGRVAGGEHISRSSRYTEKDAFKIAKIMVEKQMTYRQAEMYFGIPRSTIHDILTSKLNSEEYGSLLYALSEANKKNETLHEFINEHGDTHVNSDIVSKKVDEERVTKK